MGGQTTHDPRWAALVFTARHPDGAHAACRVPPRLPASQGLLGFIVGLLGVGLRMPDHTALIPPRLNPDLVKVGVAGQGVEAFGCELVPGCAERIDDGVIPGQQPVAEVWD